MTEKVIPNLPERSIIVMDNAPYHCTLIYKAPTISSVFYEESWTKPVLYELIKNNKEQPVFAIDNILAEHGHEDIKLSLQFKPNRENMGSYEKKGCRKDIGQNAKQIVIEAAFASITPDDLFKQCKQQRLEDEYFQNDGLIDADIQIYYFHGKRQ